MRPAVWTVDLGGLALVSRAEERLAAKRLNEQTKLSANTLNALAIALLGAAVIIPGVSNPSALLSWEPWVLLFVAVGLHFVARAFLRLLRSEE